MVLSWSLLQICDVAGDGEDCGACWKSLPGLRGTASAERTDRKETNVHKLHQKKPFELVQKNHSHKWQQKTTLDTSSVDCKKSIHT